MPTMGFTIPGGITKRMPTMGFTIPGGITTGGTPGGTTTGSIRLAEH